MTETYRMKIAFVYDVIYPYVKGGVEKRVHELAVRLAARGHEVHIFGMKFWEGAPVIEKDGVVFHGVSRSQDLYTSGRRGMMEPLRFSDALILPLLSERFDIIDCQQFPFFPALASGLVTGLRRTPLVVTWHEVWGDYWYEYLGSKGVFGKITERVVSRIGSGTIAVSATTAGRLRELSPKSCPVVIPNGIDLAEIEADPQAEKSIDLIFAGRLIREKHVDLLVEATALLLPQFPRLAVRIIGDGPEHDRIHSLVRALGLEEHVTLHSFCEDHRELIGFLKSSKVFVLPSTREGFGIAALEALACGVPVVTVDHPANAVRGLIDETTGFLCILSAEDLAEKIRAALRQSGTMREACTAASCRYDWDRIAQEMEEFYRATIEKKHHLIKTS
jgi:glycosyltransferase involved in cell wall biosynthesis